VRFLCSCGHVNDSQRPVDAVVIGGGAAGLFCAATAGARGKSIIVLEHQDRVGKKIAISGGGRCNFTNVNAGPENYLSSQPDFCKSALARYTPWDFLELVERHGIAYHEKKLGQQFCDGSARDIIDMLLQECDAAGVNVRTSVRIDSVSKPDRFRIETSAGTIEALAVIVASGGRSFPKLGATDLGYRIAANFGIRVLECRPGLVPFALDPASLEELGALSGVALPVAIAHRGTRFEEAMLFTHRGISGPAVLQISSFWNPGEPIAVDLLPHLPGDGWMRGQERSVSTPAALLASHWPRRFADTWTARHGTERPISQTSARDLEALTRTVHAWTLTPASTEGYPKAEVTVGGIDPLALSSRTMEARSVPGLYFIGEVVDVTGWLGGYNFQWAWASAHAAGESL